MSSIWEYLIALQPTPDVKEKLLKVKKDFGKKYKSDYALHSLPHISLVNFLCDNSRETMIHDYLKLLCTDQPVLEVYLSDFGFFPHHTMYVNVLNSGAIKQLQEHLNHIMTKSMNLPPAVVVRVQKLHLTIARYLDQEKFEKAKLEYQNKVLRELFFAEEIVLIKREYKPEVKGSYKWDGHETFHFGKKQMKMF